MDQIKDDLKNVQLTDDIFKDVKFRVTGEVDDKIIDLLKCGGAEHMNYFSDYVTHLIVGTEPEENDITDAIEVYEIPALLPKWVHVCAALKKLVNTKPFQYNPNKLFSKLVFCLAKPDKDLETLWSLITFNGGTLQLNLNNKCTHLITVETGSRKYLRAADFPDNITIVTPDWVMECIKKGSLADANLFHPKLIIWPKSVKHESTTAITGFEPDVPEEKEVKEESEVADSTQALLEKLKQRMPWNQPPVTTGETVAPPNVVAPGFVNKSPVVQRTMPQSPVIQQQPPQQQPQQQQQQSPTISRSVVHHTPPTSFVQQLQSPPQQQQQQMNIAARTMNPQQVQVQGPRPNMQLRGALPNQIQQQLLQQRLNQQNVMQRPAGQMVLQQQLLQQQLSQGQRQLLQGQPIQNQHQLAQLQQLKQQMQQQQQQQQNHLVQQQLMQQQQLQQQQQQQQSMLLQQQQQPPQLMQQHQQFVSQGQQFIQGQSNFVQQQNLSQQLQQKNLGQQLNQQQLVQQQQQQQPLEQQQPPQQQVIRTQFNQQIIINQSPRQQHFFQQQQGGPRTAQWSPNQQMRQYIHLDANTHNQLQKLPPEQRTAFFLKLQKDKLKQQQRGGSHILIRGAVPAGLNHQQQVQWLQQQAKQQGIALPPNLQQQTITPGTLTPQQPTQPALSPIQQPPPPFVPAPADPNQQQQQQQQLRQYRLQQLQLQREQAQKLAQQQQQQQPTVRPMVQQSADSTTAPIQPLPEAAGHHPLVVNAKTKTALANMLSIRLQSGGTSIGQEPEPSAAGTLRLMTAQHNAALNSNNRPQELLGLQQRGRVISGPNGEIIRPPGPIPTPTTPQSEPPKLQFGPRPAVPIQHNRVGPFYGHNPNLKLPSNLFLLGCIFVVVEIERYLDEAIPNWQEKIEKHGGEVEKHYCSRVTHVLCETQKHGIVMQAIRDCKRCITIYWLSDIMKRRQVLPPWTALHLPIIYLDTTPASKHLIGISGFTASERTRVKHMITYTGATVTSYFSKHNTLLVVAKAEGPKFNYAKKWAIPVVNVQWLTDVMLGNFTAMSQMEHVLYQQFPTPPNFSFDPKLVPNLMHAWKMPINISQESYERVKRCASPVSLPKKPKQPKTEQTDENDNIDDQQKFNCTHKILLSRVEDIDGTKSVIKQLGGCVVTNHQEATHLVMPELTRTNKLLFCIPLGVSILPEQWLKDSQTNNQFTNEFNYRFDVKQFNRQYQCDFNQTMSMKDRNKLFEGKTFWVSPSCFPNKKVLEELLRLSGGHVETVRRTAAQIEATNTTSPFTYFIIVHENDLHLVADLLKTKKDKITKTICSAELVYSSILRQQIDPDKYSVKIA